MTMVKKGFLLYLASQVEKNDKESALTLQDYQKPFTACVACTSPQSISLKPNLDSLFYLHF